MTENSQQYNKEVLSHYDPNAGIGRVYSLLADWPTALKTAILGWENVLEHPAVLSYARDYTGKNLNDQLRKTSEEIFANLDLEKGKVLDCGCGVGGTTLHLSKLFPKVQFIGVSLSPGQISSAQKRAQKAGRDNVNYQIANYLSLPFANESFNGIMGIETFCHIEDKDKGRLFAELKRVLKIGGKIVISDAFLNNRPQSQMHMPKLHTRIFKGWSLPDRISTLDFFLNQAQQHNFKVMKYEEITERILACAKEASRRGKLRKFLQPLAKFLIKLRS